MPVKRVTPEHKRRVRTGCLACRKRRRKCDEVKPQCTSCKARHVTCKYMNNDSTRSYANITFVSEESFSKAHSSGSEGKPVAQGASGALTAPPYSAYSASNASPGEARSPVLYSEKPFYLSSWDEYFDTQGKPLTQKGVVLLRRFQYRIAPWATAAEPTGRFAADVLQISQQNEAMQTLISELASCQSRQSVDHSTVAAATRQLSDIGGPVALVGDAMADLIEFFRASPTMWKTLPMRYFKSIAADGCSLYSVEEPLQSLCRLQSKIDLASSLFTETAPTTGLSFFIPHAGSSGSQASLIQKEYDAALRNITMCLHFVFGHQIQPSFGKIRDVQSPTGHVLPNNFNSEWQTLWTACQKWYDTRPLELQPLVDVGGVEMDKVEPDKESAFPAQLYTNATAVVANVTYHITMLLLLAQKPRLLKVTGRRHCFTSQNWHARTAAGILTSNSFLEQWDPIVVATALYIARGMTHPAQQSAIMTCLHNISTDAGIRLETEANQLQSHWSAARSFEPSILN